MLANLFAQADLRQVIRHQEQKLAEEISEMDGNRLLNTSVEDLVAYFEQEYRIEPIELDEAGITVDQEEAKVDVRGRSEYEVFDRSRPAYVLGTRVNFYVPFKGDAELFKYKPSTFTYSHSQTRIDVQPGILKLTYIVTQHNAEEIKREFEGDMGNLKGNLGRIARELAPFNSSLKETAERLIEARREKLLKDQGLAASLGFPLSRRSDALTTYVAPTPRRKIPNPLPPASTAPFTPEPTLDMAEYEHILTVMTNMVVVMERSPRAFKDMHEEDLRNHFLVQLNGQYEGQATGETFNFQGKTDIIIRVDGKNIFIAECKFWDGPKSFTRAIEQLLGYTTWRDTKTALVIFNRDRNLSTVLARIPDLVKDHRNYKRDMPCAFETGFRFVLHHNDDPNRELVLTVLVFEVPS